MLLSCRPLNNVVDVNTFENVITLEFTSGDTIDVYLQLIDLSVDKGLNPPGRRYIAPENSELTVSIRDIDSDVSLNKVCTQPFDSDLSIWKFSINSEVDLNCGSMGGTYSFSLRLVIPTDDPLVDKYISGFLGQALTVYRTTPEF